MDFLALKALHIIFIVTWFAGLFYVPRIFIYQTEASLLQEPDRSILTKAYRRNAKLLWFGITWPSAVITLIMGTLLISQNFSYWVGQTFMQIKLLFVFLLYLYHILNHALFRRLQSEKYFFSSMQLRIWNEVPTIILISVVFLIVMKNSLSWVYGVSGLILFSLALLVAIRIYRNFRQK